jgi:hypothetical protein
MGYITLQRGLIKTRLKGIENDTDKSLCDESGDGAGER